MNQYDCIVLLHDEVKVIHSLSLYAVGDGNKKKFLIYENM
jgi:hypothetical protein